MKKLWTKDFILIVLASTLQNAQMHMVNPVMSKYTGAVGVGLSFTGAIVGAFSVAALISRPPSGYIAQKLNSRITAPASALLMGVSTVLYGAAATADGGLLLGLRLAHGFSYGICTTVLMEMAGRLLSAETMRRGMGYFGLGQVVSIAAAPALGIFVMNQWGFNAVFVFSACLAAAAGVMAAFVKAPGKGKGVRFSLKNMAAAWPKVLTAAVITMTSSLETAYIVTYGESVGVGDLGLYFTVSAAVMFMVRGFAGKRADRFSYRGLLVFSLIFMAAGMGILTVAGIFGGAWVFWLFMGASALKSLGQGLAQPAVQAECMKGEKAGGAASYYMGCDLGQSIGPIAGGFIASAMGYPWVYCSAGAVLAATALCSAVFYKKRKNVSG